MLLDHPIVGARYFFPRRDPLPDPLLVRCDGAELACHRQAPHPTAKTLIHFHGNGEVVADYLPDYADALVGLGLNVLFAEYRGYGGSTGRPALAGMLADVGPVFDALGLPEGEIIVYGRSVGSLYAIELAYRHPGIAGLILESGIADLLERLLVRIQPQELGATHQELADAVAEHFDHESKLGAFEGPLLVIHARDDELVDSSHAERSHAWAGGAHKELALFDHGGHNGLLTLNWTSYLRRVDEFCKSLE